MDPVQGTKRAAEPDMSSHGGGDGGGSGSGGGGGGGDGGGGGGGLHGITAVQKAFHHLDGPADVLSVSAAKFRREKPLKKARVFEVALPAVPVVEGGGEGGEGGGGSSSAVSAAESDELAGVGHAQVFALEVRGSTQPARPSALPLHIRLINALARCCQGYKMRDECWSAAHDNPNHNQHGRALLRACLSRQDEQFQDLRCPTCPRMWVSTPGGGREMVSAHNFLWEPCALVPYASVFHFDRQYTI